VAASALSAAIRITRGAAATARGAGHVGGFTVDVAFEVPAGITILFGPSGSGKSTILSAIAGLTRPDAGRVALGEEVWFDSSRGIDRPIHRRAVAFVFQSLALFPHMSALLNVEYGIDRGVPRRERMRQALAMLERMKVHHVAQQRPVTLSGGEAQRVALARAFATAPRIALLDEPFSALDRDLRRELCADVRGAVSELGIPAIMVTHHRNEARMMGDRVLLLGEGRVLATGLPDEILPEAAPPDGGRRAILDDMVETPLEREIGT
jgi:molybdate transport system ATP-binding protein